MAKNKVRIVSFLKHNHPVWLKNILREFLFGIHLVRDKLLQIEVYLSLEWIKKEVSRVFVLIHNWASYVFENKVHDQYLLMLEFHDEYYHWSKECRSYQVNNIVRFDNNNNKVFLKETALQIVFFVCLFLREYAFFLHDLGKLFQGDFPHLH